MRHRRPTAAPRNGARTDQERSLTRASFIGSFPTADFAVSPPLPEVALLGRSNVGKSSLLNALVGRRALAHISKTPGKTRMCNVYAVGEAYYLVDLPGYGYARVSKAARADFSTLVRQYISTRADLIGVAWLLDIRRDPSAEDLEIVDMLGARQLPLLAVVTKADKVARGRRRQRIDEILDVVALPHDQCIVTSVKTREGIDDLRDSIASLVTGATE